MAFQLWEGKLLLADGAGSPKPVANHVDCCCPENECPYCTFGVGRPTSWKADLGGGGWVDSVDCDHCDQVGGEYTMTTYGSPTNCVWEYAAGRAAQVCGPGAWSNCHVSLLTKNVAAGRWKWQLRAEMSWWTDTDIKTAGVCWESADSVFSETPDCYDLGGEDSGNKIQMDQIACPFPPSYGTLCTGNLPDPVYIWVP